MRAGRCGSRGFTLIELVVTMAVASIVIGGALAFVVSQANLTADASTRSDMQTDGRRALRTLAREISAAGTGLPNYLAIRSLVTDGGLTSADSCKSPATPEFTFASVDYSREWIVASATGDSGNGGVLTLDSAIPTGGTDVEIPAGSWVYVYRAPFQSPTAATPVGHGLLRVDTTRAAGDTEIVYAAEEYSDQQGGVFQPDDGGSDAIYLFVADVTTLGVNCTDVTRPYLFMRTGGNIVPVLDNVDLAPLAADDNSIPATAGDVLALRFRLHVDTDGDDMANGTPLTTIASPNTNAILSNVTRVEFAFRLRARNPKKPDSTEYREKNYVRTIDLPNLDPNMQSYVFVRNAAL